MTLDNVCQPFTPTDRQHKAELAIPSTQYSMLYEIEANFVHHQTIPVYT